jgi:hypothetical protein
VGAAWTFGEELAGFWAAGADEVSTAAGAALVSTLTTGGDFFEHPGMVNEPHPEVTIKMTNREAEKTARLLRVSRTLCAPWGGVEKI